MSAEEEISTNPLEFIQYCVRDGKILWTYHVNMRLRERSVSRRVILESTEDYEVIDENPEDKYLPSYLVYTVHNGKVFHILFAMDIGGGNVRIITVYRPNPRDWGEDLKTRRSRS